MKPGNCIPCSLTLVLGWTQDSCCRCCCCCCCCRGRCFVVLLSAALCCLTPQLLPLLFDHAGSRASNTCGMTSGGPSTCDTSSICAAAACCRPLFCLRLLSASAAAAGYTVGKWDSRAVLVVACGMRARSVSVNMLSGIQFCRVVSRRAAINPVWCISSRNQVLQRAGAKPWPRHTLGVLMLLVKPSGNPVLQWCIRNEACVGVYR